jgi:hypothetical protein
VINFKSYLAELNKPFELRKFKSAVADVKDVDTRDPSWQGTLPELFSKYGFVNVGDGKYGTVFVNSKYPYAVKVFMKDTAYLKFIQFVLKNQSNPYVPKIRGKVVKINDMFMAIRMEKLSPSHTIGKDIALKEFVEMIQDPEYFLQGKLNLITIHNEDKHAINLCKFLLANENLLDIHLGNIMMRRNQPVLIDPLYNWYKGAQFTMDPNDISNLKDVF